MQQAEQFELWIAEHRAIFHHAVNAFASNPADRDDLMQEVLLAVWKAIPQFQGASRASTFVYRVSHNSAMTWSRTRSNYRRMLGQVAVQSMPQLTKPATASSDEIIERLYARIREFSPFDRSLLLLWLDEVSYREMAEIHGIAENLVGVRLTRARARLIEEMKEQE